MLSAPSFRIAPQLRASFLEGFRSEMSALQRPSRSRSSRRRSAHDGAPDSTVVTAGKVTTTLGKLRVAHKVREAARVNAKAAGIAAHKKLFAQPVTIVGLGHGVNPVRTGRCHLATHPKNVGVTSQRGVAGQPREARDRTGSLGLQRRPT